MIVIFCGFFSAIAFIGVALCCWLFARFCLRGLVRFIRVLCLIVGLMLLTATLCLWFSFIIWKDGLACLLSAIRLIFFRKFIYLYVLLDIRLISKDCEYTYPRLLMINNRFHLYLLALVLLVHMVKYKLWVKSLVKRFSFWALNLFQFYNYFINKFIIIW